MFEELYTAIYDTLKSKLETVFPDITVYPYEVSDVDRTRFPYFVFYVASMPRRTYLGDERVLEMLFRIRYVVRAPLNQAADAMRQVLGIVGKFADNFDTCTFEVEYNGAPLKLNGDTADTGFATSMVRDNAYVIISSSWLYRVEFAKY